MNKDEVLQEILKQKVVAVIRAKDSVKLKRIIEAIAAGGIYVAEITMTVPNAIQLIEQLSKELDSKIILGVGSVLNKQTALDAIKAGAKYVVSPILKKEIIETAHDHDVPVMPGCFTPTEIQTAFDYGADIIKVFPADVLGMNFFKSVLAPMPHLRLMPTGGVTLTNAGDWINAGACAVGIGSALIDQKVINEENYGKLTEMASVIMNSINSAKTKKD